MRKQKQYDNQRRGRTSDHCIGAKKVKTFDFASDCGQNNSLDGRLSDFCLDTFSK